MLLLSCLVLCLCSTWHTFHSFCRLIIINCTYPYNCYTLGGIPLDNCVRGNHARKLIRCDNYEGGVAGSAVGKMSGSSETSIEEEDEAGSETGTRKYSRTGPKFLNARPRTESFDNMVSDELMIALAMMKVNSMSSLNDRQKDRVAKLREKIKARNSSQDSSSPSHKQKQRKIKDQDFELSGWTTAPDPKEKAVLPLDITHEVISSKNTQILSKDSSKFSEVMVAKTSIRKKCASDSSESVPPPPVKASKVPGSDTKHQKAHSIKGQESGDGGWFPRSTAPIDRESPHGVGDLFPPKVAHETHSGKKSPTPHQALAKKVAESAVDDVSKDSKIVTGSSDKSSDTKIDCELPNDDSEQGK